MTCSPNVRKPYSFSEQKKVGYKGEAELDAYFKQYYEIVPVPFAMQTYEVDRIFRISSIGWCWSVEYKTCTKAFETGNAFVEIVSDLERGAAGWVFRSVAQVLVYYIPQTGHIRLANMFRIRKEITRWQSRYETRPVFNRRGNRHWTTVGIPVPLAEFDKRVVFKHYNIQEKVARPVSFLGQLPLGF